MEKPVLMVIWFLCWFLPGIVSSELDIKGVIRLIIAANIVMIVALVQIPVNFWWPEHIGLLTGITGCYVGLAIMPAKRCAKFMLQQSNW